MASLEEKVKQVVVGPFDMMRNWRTQKAEKVIVSEYLSKLSDQLQQMRRALNTIQNQLDALSSQCESRQTTTLWMERNIATEMSVMSAPSNEWVLDLESMAATPGVKSLETHTLLENLIAPGWHHPASERSVMSLLSHDCVLDLDTMVVTPENKTSEHHDQYSDVDSPRSPKTKSQYFLASLKRSVNDHTDRFVHVMDALKKNTESSKLMLHIVHINRMQGELDALKLMDMSPAMRAEREKELSIEVQNQSHKVANFVETLKLDHYLLGILKPETRPKYSRHRRSRSHHT